MSTTILGIETSCDETAAAVVQDGHRVLSNVIHSQVELHQRWRGVVPEVASRSHTERILPIVTQALEEARVAPEQLDAIAVTHRPGMVGCLLVGMAAAKALAWRAFAATNTFIGATLLSKGKMAAAGKVSATPKNNA